MAMTSQDEFYQALIKSEVSGLFKRHPEVLKDLEKTAVDNSMQLELIQIRKFKKRMAIKRFREAIGNSYESVF